MKRILCFCIIGCILFTGVSAEAANGEFDPPAQAVRLDAPEPLRAFLLQHLDLPTTLTDDLARTAMIRRTRRMVNDLLATEGYFSPRIDINIAAAALVITVDPGPPTQVVSIDIEFLGHLAGDDSGQSIRRATLREGWLLDKGKRFRSSDWEVAKAALLSAAAEADYAAAHIVVSRAEVDPEKASARLSLTLDSGPAYRFGPLTIDGLKRYDAPLVRGLMPFTQGEAYRRDALLSFQSRLQNAPWFHSVVVEADPAAAVGAVLPVHVALDEAPSKRVGFGLGYSTNSGARSEVNFLHHDFLGRAWDLNSGLRLEEKQNKFFADLGLLPDALGYRTSFSSRLEKSDIQGLVTTSQVLGAARSRTQGRIETRLGLEWQREEHDAETDRALLLDWRWVYRAVDDSLNPRQGNILDFSIGGASQRLLSDRNFVRSHLRVQQWWPIGQLDALTLRGEAGFTAAASPVGIPQAYLFRVGGAQSVRGYDYQSLGVRDGNTVVGGRAMLAGSLEYTHWFDGPWGAAVFLDAGDAADTWRDLKPATGSGAGVRWKSPAGPLALDLARGARTGDWLMHFSLMVAF